MNRIAFIIPTFNRAHFIVEALDAVTRQMGPDDTLLVVDDGSTDATQAMVEAYRPRVRYVRQDNRGKSAALNHALALTESEFVWICDDDDVTEPGAVALLHAELAGSDAGFVFGRHRRFRMEGGQPVDLGIGYWPDLGRGSILRHLLEDSFVMQNATLIRRSALREMGPFDETLVRSIDYDMFVRLALQGHARYVDAVVFAQRKHDGLRGPESDLHSAAAAMTVWAEWDRRVFDKVAATVTLGTFETLFQGGEALLIRRAALLQRACVWGRHHRWQPMIDDLEAALRIAPATPLHAVERGICGRILGGKHGFAALLGAGPVAVEFRRSLARSANGRLSGWAMVRGVRWLLRHHDPLVRRAARTMVARVAQATLGRGLVASRLEARRPDRFCLIERTDPLAKGRAA